MATVNATSRGILVTVKLRLLVAVMKDISWEFSKFQEFFLFIYIYF